MTDTWSGADYARHSSLQAAMADEVLSKLPLQGDEQLLDVGCGDGKLSARIAAQLPRGAVLGVDASADMVAFARQQFDAAAWPNLRFEVVDARRLNFDARFDRVVSFNALHWVPQQAEALRGIRAALKPQGRAHLRLVTRAALTSLEEVAEAVRKEPTWAPHFAGFSDPYLRLDAQQYGELAASLGLRTISSHSADEALGFRQRGSLLRLLQCRLRRLDAGAARGSAPRFRVGRDAALPGADRSRVRRAPLLPLHADRPAAGAGLM